MANLQKAFILRALDSNLNSLAPSDKILLLKDGINSSGAHSLSLDGFVRDGAQIKLMQFHHLTVASGVVTSAAAVPGDVTVTNLVIFDAIDLEMDGGE